MTASTPALILLNSTSPHQSSGEEVVDHTVLLWGPKRDTLWVVVPVTVYYVIIFVSGVVGNVCTCVVVARNKHMHTATNYYLFSLAVSDLLLLVAGMPAEIYHIWSNYPYVFGETFCVLTGFASETSTNATVLTITAFTIERYVAICHPFLSHTVSKLSRAVKFIMVIWVLSLSLAVPQAIQMGIWYPLDDHGNIETEEYSACTVKYSIVPYSFFVSSVVFFLTPMTLITVLYVLIGVRLHRSSQITESQGGSQRRRVLLRDKETPLMVRGSQRNGSHSKSTKRVVKMLVAVVVAFFVCWAPFQMQRLYSVFGFSGDDTTPTEVLVYKVMTYASGIFYYLSTTINPILYNIMSLKFRQAFKSTLTKCLGKDRQSGELASCGGGSLGAGRSPFAAISRCSSRNNNSVSSGNSYVEPSADLSKRPLVVSFRRRSARTSVSSLEFSDRRKCCEPPPQARPPPPPPLPRPQPSSIPVTREPRVEDIEIFQECQLKIQRSVRRSVSALRQDKCRTEEVVQDPLRIVRKSFTVPCLVLH